MNKRNTTLAIIAFLIILIGAIAVVLIASELTNDDDDSNDTTSKTSQENQSTNEEETNSPPTGVVSQPQIPTSGENTKTYDITMSNFTFSPNIIEANAGDTLKIKLTSLGGTHNFVIDELDVQSLLLGSNESQDLTITIPDNASGITYQFYCSIGNHKEMGMVGEIRVV